jgi:hypothetical protein
MKGEIPGQPPEGPKRDLVRSHDASSSHPDVSNALTPTSQSTQLCVQGLCFRTWQPIQKRCISAVGLHKSHKHHIRLLECRLKFQRRRFSCPELGPENFLGPFGGTKPVQMCRVCRWWV